MEKIKNNTTANKGEWSEFYAFLKILDERQLPAADKNLLPVEGKFFVFNKIIREEKDEPIKIYDFSESGSEVIITDEVGKIIKKVSNRNLNSKILSIFEKIKSGKDSSFEIPEAKDVMEEFLCTKVKASNNKKADILLLFMTEFLKQCQCLVFLLSL